ncbi:MAG: hypothetical protein FWG50_14260 [Kiritimatiellaeota bacterium]|nr:hypothetical protein [Kiritimatiellota bacterium]
MARSCLTVAIVLAAGIGLAQQSAKPSPTLRPLSSTAKAVGVPTEAEIASFIETYKESETETIKLSAAFTVPEQTPDALKRYAKSGKVPYRVTFELVKSKTVNGQTQSAERVLDGRATVAILDENGALLKRAQESLANLCPS